MIVVDANLLVALVVESPNAPIAEDVLRTSRHWHAPILWRSEVANILIGYLRRKAFSLDDAQRRWDRLAQVISDGEHVPDARHVLALASTSGCTAYDCEYVAVAEMLGVPLLTFDRELLRAFPRIALGPQAFLDRS